MGTPKITITGDDLRDMDPTRAKAWRDWLAESGVDLDRAHSATFGVDTGTAYYYAEPFRHINGSVVLEPAEFTPAPFTGYMADVPALLAGA